MQRPQHVRLDHARVEYSGEPEAEPVRDEHVGGVPLELIVDR